MSKCETVKRLEGILDSLQDTKMFCIDLKELVQLENHYTKMQEEYRKLTGDYYRKNRPNKESFDYEH